ncbi:copper resistance protein CopC [Paraglaciecola aquimarina]|uniref:Copper resistance protein CopC n=1 Tax=Paraglaciecola aquimarina TaxID=1235557 RepID=A0ABU3SRQ1_9ALTE|nr:copper resistance protein CopC [Paraglaciecola aquimarina]MDU0352691.1 copper resistance protein CopC [Paraglaciecola aquimarina]
MKTLIKFLTVISVVFSSAVFAHVHLEKSVPANNAMLMKTPDTLALKFSKEVRVIKVSLKNKQGKEFKFGFEPSKASSSEFLWRLLG